MKTTNTSVALLVITITAIMTGSTTSSLFALPLAESSSFVGAWPYGPARAVAIDPDRNLAFFGSGGAVVLADITDPADIVRLPVDLETNGVVENLFFDEPNQRIYVATGKGGFEIWDVSFPSAPERLSVNKVFYFSVEAPVHAVVVLGDFAYVAADFGLVHWFDVADPTNPVDLGFNGQGGAPSRDLFLADGSLYVAGSDFIRFAIQADGSLFAMGVDINLGLTGTDVFVLDNRAYVITNGNLVILNLDSIFLPIIGSYAFANAADVVVSGTNAFIADLTGGLRVLDISDPASLMEIGFDDAVGLLDVHFFAGNIYASGTGRFHVIDVFVPSQPTGLSSIETPGIAYDVEVVGDYAYVADGFAGLVTIDISDPSSPVQVNITGGDYAALDLSLAGGYAYLAAQFGGLRIFDLSDPAGAVEVGFHSTPYYARGVFCDGSYAYVADLTAGLRIFDISTAAVPVEVGSAALPDYSNHVDIQGDFAYIANGDAGLQIVDISDRTQPVVVGQLGSPNYVGDVCVRGDTAYLAAFGAGLRIVDVSNPELPALLGVFDPTGIFANAVVVTGGKAFVTDQGEGVYVVDVSNSSHPVQVDMFETPGSAFGVFTSQGLLHVADGIAGIRVHQAAGSTSAVNPPVNPGLAGNLVVAGSPNPFTFRTSLQFKVPADLKVRPLVTLGIYNLRGARVRSLINTDRGSGVHHVDWDGCDDFGRPVPSGVYFAHLRVGTERGLGKIVVTR